MKFSDYPESGNGTESMLDKRAQRRWTELRVSSNDIFAAAESCILLDYIVQGSAVETLSIWPFTKTFLSTDLQSSEANFESNQSR